MKYNTENKCLNWRRHYGNHGNGGHIGFSGFYENTFFLNQITVFDPTTSNGK